MFLPGTMTVAHNILDPELPASITVSRFPALFARGVPPVRGGLTATGHVLAAPADPVRRLP